MKYIISSILLSVAVLSCGSTQVNKKRTEGVATVENRVCSRGCNQWVLRVENNMDNAMYLIDTSERMNPYQQDGLRIYFVGKKKNGKYSIKKPSENDIPVHDIYAELIVLDSISVQP